MQDQAGVKTDMHVEKTRDLVHMTMRAKKSDAFPQQNSRTRRITF